MNRMNRSSLLILILPVFALLLAGCGGLFLGRGLNLTGGSVPVGTSKAAVILDPGVGITGQMPSPDVRLDLLTIGNTSRSGTALPIPPVDSQPGTGGDPITEPGPIRPVDPGGSPVGDFREYLFDNLPVGRYDLNVTVPGSTAFAPYKWSFDLPGGTMARMVAALWPVSFNPESVGDIQIGPRYVTVSPGEIVRFFGAATDVSGEPISQSVSYMLIGDTGELAPKGLYTARRLGRSTITAWMNGKTATAEINVVP